MALFIAVFMGVSFTSCGDDNDKDYPDYPDDPVVSGDLDPKLIGTWIGDWGGEGHSYVGKSTLTFKANGQYSLREEEWDDNDGEYGEYHASTENGYWTVEGEYIHFNITSSSEDDEKYTYVEKYVINGNALYIYDQLYFRK